MTIQKSSTRHVLAPLSLPVTIRASNSKSEDWRDDALCAQVDPDLWFPEAGQTGAQARKLCRSCEVREECLEYALEHDERYGIWGGLSERARYKLKRNGRGRP